MKRSSSISLIFVIIGTFIGAGFASGKEVATYFARYKLWGLFFIILAGFVFYYFINLCLKTGAKLQLSDNNYLYKTYFGRTGGFLKLLVVTASFVVIGAMIAGNTSLFVSLQMWQMVLVNVTMLVLVGIIVSFGYDKIAKTNVVLLPLIIISMLVVCGLHLHKNDFDVTMLATSGVFVTISAFISCLEYMAFNLMIAGVFLLEIGKHYNYKQIKIASFVSAVFLSGFMFLVATILISAKGNMDSNLPILKTAFDIHQLLGIIIAVVMFFALLTSLISTTYTLYKYLQPYIKNKIANLSIILAVGFLISLFGFSFIVVNLYAIVGVVGVLFCTAIVVNQKNLKVK